MSDKIFWNSNARITKESNPCYFCNKDITGYPYYEFQLFSDGILLKQNVIRMSHIRCFKKAKKDNEKKGDQP